MWEGIIKHRLAKEHERERKISSSIDIWSRLDTRKVLSVIKSNKSDVFI